MYPDEPERPDQPQHPHDPAQPSSPAQPEYPGQARYPAQYPAQYLPYDQPPYPPQRTAPYPPDYQSQPPTAPRLPAYPGIPDQLRYQPYPAQPYAPPLYPPPPPPRPRKRAPLIVRLGLSLLVALLIAGVALGGLGVLGATYAPETLVHYLPITATSVTGTVYGENLAQREAGRFAATTLTGAKVACGPASAMTDAGGHFALALLRGREYTCLVSAPKYTSRSVHIMPGMARAYHVTIGPDGPAGSCAPSTVTAMACPALALIGGVVSGQVTAIRGAAPIVNSQVICWDNSPTAQASDSPPTRYIANTDDQGHYTLTNTPAGPYLCVANQQGAPQAMRVTPGATTTLNFSECATHCSGVTYHSGPVLHSFKAYVIFWAPHGVSLEPNGGDARFQTLVKQYLTDVGGTSFFGILTQYWDLQGPVRNVSTLAGATLDTRPYPHAGTRADPLTDGDVIDEISQVRQAKGWAVTDGSVFILVAGYNVQECAKFSNGTACSYPLPNNDGFCAYHSFTPYYDNTDSGSTFAPYIYLANNYDCAYLPSFNYGPAPYGDQTADAVINSLSHEQFESVSDPESGGWYDHSASDGEIADKCATTFGPTAGDGSTLTLAHGHSYVLQEEYSNQRGGCSYH